MNDLHEYKDVFNVCRTEIGVSFDTDSAADLLDKLQTDNDFEVDIDGGSYRFIDADDIDEIWTDSLIELLHDCYEVPDNLANYIDYDKWADDCKVDGMGHHFSGYDGSEYEACNDKNVIQWHIFRTN